MTVIYDYSFINRKLNLIKLKIHEKKSVFNSAKFVCKQMQNMHVIRFLLELNHCYHSNIIRNEGFEVDIYINKRTLSFKKSRRN